MRTIVTIKLLWEKPDDNQFDVLPYLEAIRQLLTDNVEEVEVRQLIDFGAIKKGEPPIVVDVDEELAPEETNEPL